MNFRLNDDLFFCPAVYFKLGYMVHVLLKQTLTAQLNIV